MARLTEKERIEILMMVGYGDKLRSHEEACALFNEVHFERAPIARSTVSKIVAKFNETGSVRDIPRSGRPRISDDTKLNLLLSLEENPHASTTEMALQETVSQSFVVKLLKKEKLHPYKVQLIHELSEDDPDRRLEFCDMLMRHCDENPNFLSRVVFSDEATFYLSGTVNRHNCRYWARQNPHWVQTKHTQHPQKINVWVGIVGRQFIGPYFFHGNLTAERYLDHLRTAVLPDLIAAFPDPNNAQNLDPSIWFQQDGAPPHYGVNVRRFLDNQFERRWIGRRGPMEWPPRSPDLTPLDFFLWGHLKSRVYKNRPNNLEDLMERIRHEMNLISPQIIENSVNQVYHRLGVCQIVNGAQFEQFL